MKLSPIYVVETALETKTCFGEYEHFTDLETLQDAVQEDPDKYDGANVWVVDLNKIKRQHIVLSAVAVV